MNYSILTKAIYEAKDIDWDEFLKYFGLNKITDLPKPREVEEIMNDDDFLEQKRQIMMNQMEEVIENEVDNNKEVNDEFDQN